MCDKNENNTRKIWQHLNILLGRNQLHNSSVDCHDLNAVNDYFSNLGPSIVKDLPSIRKKLLILLTRL